MKIEYAILVKNKTRLEMLTERFNTQSQAAFYIERQGGHFEDYEREHEQFHDSLNQVQAQLSSVIKHKTVERQYVPSYIFSEKNLVVVIGQDGLVANTAKYAKGRPIVAVNPDKNRYDGVLLPFNTSNFLQGVVDVIENRAKMQTMRFAEATLNDGQRLLAFNDLFIGAGSHVSARYKISYNSNTEEHSSSGLIVSTKAGSTGWLSSIFNMAFGINGSAKEKTRANKPVVTENELLFAVREPFKSMRTQTGIITGKINEQVQLTIESLMPQGGVIFSDGIESDFLGFNSGSIATIGLAQEKAFLVKSS